MPPPFTFLRFMVSRISRRGREVEGGECTCATPNATRVVHIIGRRFCDFLFPQSRGKFTACCAVFARLTSREWAGTGRLVACRFSPHVFPELVGESVLSKEKIATGLQHLSIVSTPHTSPLSKWSAYRYQDSVTTLGAYVEQLNTTNSTASPAYHACPMNQREQRERDTFFYKVAVICSRCSALLGRSYLPPDHHNPHETAGAQQARTGRSGTRPSCLWRDGIGWAQAGEGRGRP